LQSIEAPDGANVTIAPDVKEPERDEDEPDIRPETTPNTPSPESPDTTGPFTEPDRRPAEYVLSIGRTIRITENGTERQIGAVGDLPREAFHLTDVDLSHHQTVSDAGLAYFKNCKNLGGIRLDNTQVSDAALADLASLPSLTVLDLTNTRISQRGHDQLKTAMPNCESADYQEMPDGTDFGADVTRILKQGD